MSDLKRALGLQDDESPFPWQEVLLERFRGGIGSRLMLDLPTGLENTSVMAAWLVARLQGYAVPAPVGRQVDDENQRAGKSSYSPILRMIAWSGSAG